MSMRPTWSALPALVLALWSVAASAQSTTGSISGVIADSSGAILPGADIVVVHTDTGLERRQVTDATGFFRVLNLNPGIYVLTAEMPGFRSRTVDALAVSVTRDLRVDLSLRDRKSVV